MPTDLPENDRKLVEAARRGVPWKARIPKPTPAQLAEPDFVRTMPVIQATTIRALCLGLWDDVTVHQKGVGVWGAQIAGPLDLSYGTAQVPLRLYYCHIAERPDFRQASLPFLNLSGNRLEAGLHGERLRIGGSLFLRKGFTALGEIRLRGAEIGGQLNFRGAALDGNGGDALSADGIKVKGNIICDDEFTATGTIRFLGAEIGGALVFTRATLNGKKGSALNADRIKVKGNILCKDGFTATGEVCLLGAEIGGDLEFDGAVLESEGSLALNAESANIAGSVLCREDFRIQGDADFSAVRVDVLFDWRPTQWSGGLNLRHARVGWWRDGWTGHKWGCADADGKGRSIHLTDFVYTGFLEGCPIIRDAPSRIEWVRKALDGEYRPGPYEVLAAALRRDDDEDGAKAVQIAKHRDARLHRWKSAQGSDSITVAIRTLWDWLLDVTYGYGYAPWRGASVFLFMFFVGWLVFSLSAPTTAAGTGIIKPAHPITIMQDLHRRADCTGPDNAKCAKRYETGCAKRYETGCAKRYETGQNPHRHDVLYDLPSEYTPFNAFWYSLDTLIPLVDLGQEKAWSPSPHGTMREDPKGWMVLGYLYCHIMVGWILSTLTVVALSGLIKRDRE